LESNIEETKQRKTQTRSEATPLGREAKKKNAFRFAPLERLFFLTLLSVATLNASYAIVCGCASFSLRLIVAVPYYRYTSLSLCLIITVPYM